MAKQEKKKRLAFSVQVLVAMLTGAILGSILHAFVPAGYVRDDLLVNGIMYLIGQGFIRLMQMLVVPLVFCSLVCGSMSIGDTKTLGRVGIRTLLFYLATTAIAIALALGIALVINPGIGVQLEAVEQVDVSVSQPNVFDVLLNIIPKNPVAALSSGEMLQIIVFAIFVGIVLARLGNRASTVANFFNQFNEVMMEMTQIVLKVAPYGVFCLIGRTFTQIGVEAFLPMLKYMGSVTLGLILHCFVIYSLLLFLFTRLNPFRFLKKFYPVMLLGFTTSISNATIPLNIETLEKKIGVSRKISSFTIPLGATINMDGTAIMQGVAVIFIAQIYGITLAPTQLLMVVLMATLASIGTAAVPSVGVIMLSMVLSAVGLPVEGIAFIMGVDRILDMMRTAVNVTGDAVCTTIVANQNHELNREVFNRD